MATKKKNKYLESISKSASKIESNKEKYAQKEQYDKDTLFGSARSTISENRLRESNNIGESPYKNLSIIRANRQKEEEEAQGSIFDIARNNIASGAASYNRAEKSYMDSLPNDAYRFAYQQSKNTDGVYVSPYFSKGIEGKEKLTYNNDEWNRLSEGVKKGYLEWAQQELDKESKKKKPNLERDNKYLNYAMSILNETNQTVRTIGDTHNISGNLFRTFVPDRLEDALGMNKESADTFNKDQELQIMLNMMPEEVRQYLTTGMVPLLRENQELKTTAAIKEYLSNYYSDDMVDKLSKYARKVENIQRQQERNADIERKMDNPFYATVVAPAGQVGMDLLVKPVAGAVDLVRASSEANKGIYGEFDPLQTGVQRMAQDARYINESINEGLGKGGQFIYNTSMSGLESAARMYLANGLARSFPFLNQEVAAKTFLTGMMSSAVFNDSLNENIQKGMDIGDAMSSAMAHSLFESLFEELSFDKLGYFKEAPVMYSKKDFAKSLIKAGFVEGSEEAFTDIANELYDHYVGNYDFSEYKAFKDKYLASNPDATDRDIWWEFTKQFSLQVAQSFAGGALSSFALSSTNNMSALRRGEMYIQNGKNVSDVDFARMDSFVKEMAAVNPEIADEYKKATQNGEDAKRGFVKMVTEEYSEKFNKAIEQADTKDKLNIVMNNANTALHGAISEDTFNTYNAKLVELGEAPADYNTFVQNRAQTNAETTFSDLAYGKGDNAISRNIVEASKSIAETQENADMDKSVREEAIKKLTEKVETNVKKAEEMVARYAEMGVPMDSPEVRQFESVLGLQNMAQMYSAGKLAAQNLNLPATTQKSGKLYQVKQNSAEAKKIFGENAKHIIEAPFEEVKNSTAYSLGKVISRMTGVNIGFYKSDRKAIQNGAYDAKTNTLYLDVNAGTSGSNYAIGEVFSHELTHWIRANNEEGYQKLMDFIKTDMGAEAFESLVKDHIEKDGLDENVASEEVVAEACQRMLENSEVFKRYAAQDLEGAKTLLQRLVDFIRKLREAFKGSLNNEATRMISDLEGLQQTWETALQEAIGETSEKAAEGILENKPSVAEEIVGADVVTKDSVKSSQRLNDQLMEEAEKLWKKNGRELGISYNEFYGTVALCKTIARRMLTDLAPYLPEDNPGKVEVGNASYGRSMENAMVCIRSIVNNDFTDMVSEELGRPLTVEEQLVASQVLQLVNERPECNYCYVATDRRAYRASFGTYFKQYQSVFDKVSANRDAFQKDLSGAEGRMKEVKVDGGEKNNGNGVVAQAYAEFLNGRKNTPDMRKRFLGWVNSAVKGDMPISLKDLTSARVRGEARTDSAKKWFIDDAENYAQKATWAKKTSRVIKINGKNYVADYVSYNGSILKWKPTLVESLNKEFGLRMYSFSDYVPAFLLENMQMILDASLRGLKVLAYTKDCGFAEAFASTGAGINISLFGTLDVKARSDENLNALREAYKNDKNDATRNAYLSALEKYVVKDGIGGKDGMMGANWERATSLRKSYDNVGTVFVATNDDLVEWALANPDIDVVIPYHLVRTGEEVAAFFDYKNYKAHQEDKKKKSWTSENKKAISPVDHGNDYKTYKYLLNDNNLEARFSEYEDNPNYMKLVNETRMSYKDMAPVHPTFEQDVIMRELNRIKDDGQYGLMPGFKTKAEQDAFIENQNLVGQAVDAIGEWNETGKKPIDETRNSSRDSERGTSADELMKSNRGLTRAQAEFLEGTKTVDEKGKLIRYEFVGFSGGIDGSRFYLSGRRKGNTYIRSVNPWIVSEHGSPYSISYEELSKIKLKGYDSIFFDIPDGQRVSLEVRESHTFDAESGTVFPFDNSNVLDVKDKNPEKPVTTVVDKSEYTSSTDSSGNELTEEQVEFFKNSEARDKDGNLLHLYSGSYSGGFTVFKEGMIWLTTNYESARAYGGSVEGNNFAPSKDDKKPQGEAYSVEKRIEVPTTSEDADSFYFDSQEDLDAFEKKIGGKVSDYMDSWELEDLEYEAYDNEEKYAEYERRKELSERIRDEYRKYEREHLRYTTIAELLKNPDAYIRADFVRAWYALDNNAIIDEDGIDSKESLMQALIDNYEERDDLEQSLDDYYNISVLARVPEGTSSTGETYNDTHMVYELYANLKTPYIIDNGGKRLNADGSIYYNSIDYAYDNRDIYDGCIVTNVEVGPSGSGLGTAVVAFSPNQVKSVNNTNPTESDDIRFSYRDLANSESEILVNALKNDATLVDQFGARKSVEVYAKAYGELKEMENQAIEYAKQLKKGTSPSEREAILRKQVRLDRAILNKTTELTEMRNQRVIRDLLIDEWEKRDEMIAIGRAEERYQTRKVLEGKYGEELKALRAKNKAKQTEIRNRFEINKRKKNIETKAKALMKMILNPTEKKHIPSVLVNPITDLLDSIDYWTPAEGRPTTKKSESLRTRFEDFRSAINEYQKQIDDGAEQIELMFDPEFLETVDDLCNSVKGIDNVNDMSVQDIIDLDHTLTELLHLISRGNKMIKAYHYETIKDAVDATAETMDKLDTLSSKTSAKGNLRMRLNAGMADSYAFGRYAGDGTKQIIDSLSKAFEEKISKVKQAIEFTQEVIAPYKKDLKKWSKDTHEFTLSTTDEKGNPNKVSLTVGQMMELYLLNKREQARGHIYGGGIRVEDRKGRYTESVKVTEEDVQEIVNYLATVPGAIEVADKLQKYGATTITGWGNEASNLMYGFAKFTEPDYWQIRSDSSALKDNENTEAALNASMYRLQNMGRTKAVKKGANNAIYVGDVFDTWSKTIDEMTSYASILPSTTDAMRWWNSRIVNESGDAVRIKKLLESKLGTDMTKVFTETIKALNGGIMGTDSLESLVKVLTGKAKAAAVAGNLRVVLQQPTAYTRAAAVIEPKYLLKALKMKPNAKEAQEHSAIAWHKAQGFYSNGLAPSLRKLVIGDGSFGENLTEKSLWLAGKADDITWGALWNASKLKVEDENKALKKGSDEYWEEVNKVFSDIINNTQVVDTPLTKSTWMRGNGLGVFFTAFMAEPTKTYSMVMTAVEDLVRNPKSKQAQKTVALVGTVFAVNAAVNALAQALADAARDDDKEKSYWEKYVEKYTEDIKDNLNPLTYIPVVKDIFSLWNGYSNNNLAMQAAQNTVYAVQELQKIAKGTSKKTLFGQMETCAKAVSSWTGIPFGNVMRTFNSFGNIVGIDTFRRKKYTKSELGRNVVLSIKEGNTAEATEYWNQLVREVGEDEISEAYGYISTYLAEHDDNVDAYAVAFLEDANNLETQAEDLMRKYEYNEYITLDVATDAIRKAARADQKAEAEAKGEKYKQTVSSTNSGGTIYNSSDVNRALERGNIDEAQKVIDKINAGYKTQGSNSTAKSAVSNYWKPKYLSATGAERDRIARMLYKLKNNGKQMFSSKDLQKWVSDANKSNK